MSTFQIKSSSDSRNCLIPALNCLRDYIEKKPIPFGEVVIQLQPVRAENNERIVWKWAREFPASTERAVWQGECDVYLRKKFTQPFSLTVPSVLIEILPRSACECDPVGLIKGEGLATFRAVEPKYKLDDLVITDSLMRSLREVVSIVKNSKLIYETWGFGDIERHPRAVVNFYGPPGTGKTMAAHCIADALGKKIVIANFAEIESKYVGDSPKNLENIFKTASLESAVLFFDEADSFLGKRLTSVSSSSDQSVNSLRSKLLQLLEDYDGVVVFCTNLLRNYDKAFDSRILRSLKFDLPNASERVRLLKRMIPKKLPLATGEEFSDSAYEELSNILEGFAGREIKNAILQVLCSAAECGTTAFTVKHFRDGFLEVAEERTRVLQSRGELDSKHKKKVEDQIAAKLKSGDFVQSPTAE